MNKKGFTLIELLATLIILAIISTITIPIVTSIINDSKESSGRKSLELYGRSIENSVKSYMASNNGKIPVGNYYSKGKFLYLKSDDSKTDIGIEYKGTDLYCDTVIIYQNGNVYIEGCKIDNKYIYQKDSEKDYYIYGNKVEQILVNNIAITYDESCETNETCRPAIVVSPETANIKQLSFALSESYGLYGSYTNSTVGALSINKTTGKITKLDSFIDNSCYFVDVIVKTIDGSNITKTLTIQITSSDLSNSECDKW